LASEEAVTVDVTAPYALTVDADGIVTYTSGSYYIPVGGQTLRQWNLNTQADAGTFATVPATSGPNPGVRGLCPIATGGFLATNGAQIVRLDADGVVTQTYTPSLSGYQFLPMWVEMTPDEQSFWVSDLPTGFLVKIGLESGAQEQTVRTGLRIGTHVQFAIFDVETPIVPNFETETVPIRRVRRFPHLSSEQVRIFYSMLQIDIQPGVGLTSGQGSDPKIMVRWSDDGGFTWSNELTMAIGKRGNYQTRAILYRLGQARDRVFEISVSDPVPIAWTDAFLRLEPGTS
jgi:hypothetical protein